MYTVEVDGVMVKGGAYIAPDNAVDHALEIFNHQVKAYFGDSITVYVVNDDEEIMLKLAYKAGI